MDESTFNYKLVIAYDGTRYGGWQVQPNAQTIQEVLQQTLALFLRQEVKVIGAGRTDAGVHALGQVANFTIDKKIDEYKFIRSANGLLPADIRIKSIEQVPLEFHSQYSAKGKIYHYHLYLDRVEDPFKNLYTYRVLGGIDRALLVQAASKFAGTHDFAAFANSADEGVASYDSIRTMYRVDVIEEEGGVRIEFEGDGFLYKMVRNIVGTLLEIAQGKKEIGDIDKIIASRDRRLAGRAVPPQGLFLVEVIY
jgi:tRNA pseudouridine38-40 synthase